MKRTSLKRRTGLSVNVSLKRGGPLKSRSPRKASKRNDDFQWQGDVVSRADGRCEYCGDYHGVVGHHVLGKRAFPRLRFLLANGVALCRMCHGYAHNSPEKFNKWFEETFPEQWRDIQQAKKESR